MGERFASAPSLWVTPEYQALQKLLHLELIDVDQGPLGHPIRKPTTLACTKGSFPEWARGIKGMGTGIQVPGGSAAWARWAPGLKQAAQEWLKAVLIGQAQRLDMVVEVVKRAEANGQTFRQHILAGHTPFRKDCYACVAGRARKQHFRQSVSEAFVLSVDLAGPLKPGLDENTKARYFLAASFSVPRDSKLREPEEAPEPEEGDQPAVIRPFGRGRVLEPSTRLPPGVTTLNQTHMLRT